MAQLIRTHGPSIADPTPGQILETLNALLVDTHGFATLRTDDGVVQSAGVDGTGLTLEYALDEVKEICRAQAPPLPPGEVAEVFVRFQHGDRSWIDDYTWEQNALVSGLTKGCAGSTAVVALMLAAGVWMAFGL